MDLTTDDLFSALSANAGKLAARSMLDADDIRQELYLMCMEVAEGRSAYNPVIGGVNEYIMGRLWGLVRRWKISESLDAMDDDPDIDAVGSMYYAQSVEDILSQQQAMLEQDVQDVSDGIRMQKQQQNMSTLEVLLRKGVWSSREAAKYCGVSRYAIEKILASSKCHPVSSSDISKIGQAQARQKAFAVSWGGCGRSGGSLATIHGRKPVDSPAVHQAGAGPLYR